MAQTTAQVISLPLIDDVTVKDSFADFCAGINFTNGNVHITFASITADHSRGDPSPQRRVVSARVVISLAGAIELRDLLTRIIEALTAQGIVVPTPSSPTVVTPSRPN
jgi:hypothetical protein